MNILKHTVLKDIYEHGLMIEKLPASELQTKISVQNANLAQRVDQLIDALRDSLIPYRDDMKKVLVTQERMETWRKIAEVDK